MMISPVHGRPHQVHCAGVYSCILLVGMLLMNHLRHQVPVRPHHIASQFCIDCYLSHSRRNQNFLISLPHALAYHPDIIRLLIRVIGNADPTGKIDKGNMCPGFLLQLCRQLKQLSGQCRIVLVGHSIAGKESMYSEFLHALCFQDTEPLKHLLFRKTVFCLSGIVHNIRPHGKISSRIEPAAQTLRQIPQSLFQKFNMRNIVQVNGSAKLLRQHKFLCRRIIGGKHDILPLHPHRMAQHQFCIRRTIRTAAIFSQNIHQKRIRRGFHCKKLLISPVPGKCLFQSLRVLPDALFIVNMKGRWIILYNIVNQFFCHKSFLFHPVLLFRFSSLVRNRCKVPSIGWQMPVFFIRSQSASQWGPTRFPAEICSSG